MLQRVPGSMKAGAVELGSGDAAVQRRAEGPTSARHDPVHAGEPEPQRVTDLPDRGGAREQPLQFIAQGDGETGGEVTAPARGKRPPGAATPVTAAAAVNCYCYMFIEI